MIVQFIVFIAASFSFYFYTQTQISPIEAYVFNNKLSVNQEISEADIKKVEIPQSAVTSNFALNKEEIIGKYVATDIEAGQYVYKFNLLEEGELDVFKSMDMTKLRKISIPISYTGAFGGNINRGDSVDLVYTGSGKGRSAEGSDLSFQYSKVFLQNVLVYNVTTSEGFPYIDHTSYNFSEHAGEEVTPNMEEVAVVTLAVTLEQAEEITARLAAGNIRMVGRFNEHESYETLGFVLGDYEKVFSASVNAETGRSTINE